MRKTRTETYSLINSCLLLYDFSFSSGGLKEASVAHWVTFRNNGKCGICEILVYTTSDRTVQFKQITEFAGRVTIEEMLHIGRYSVCNLTK